MNWNKKSVRDSGGFWTDHMSDNGQFIIAQGYEEWHKMQGRPWGLFDCSKENAWKSLGYFPDVDSAKTFLVGFVEANSVSQTAV